MTDAKPDVGALVEELRRRSLPDPHDEREVRHADVFTRCRTALLALQAMLEKAWKLNEDMGVVVTKQRAERITLRAEVARLTQENARLAREAKQTAYLRAKVADGEEPPR